MIKNNKKSYLNDEQLFSIFSENIPRKILYNSFINNNNPIKLNSNYCNNIKNDINQPISIFNPYDTEIDSKYNDDFKRKKLEFEEPNKNEKNDINLDNNNNIYNDYNDYGKNDNENLFIKKLNNYINISSDEGSNLNQKNEKKNYVSPELKLIKNNNFAKISLYSINKNKDKEIYFTDLKKGLDAIKIKSTNYSSNMSYDNKDSKIKNNNKKEISTLNKISIFNINKNNKNNKKLKRIKFHENTIINDKKKENKTDHNKKERKIPMLRSTIQYTKSLKTIDEYMEINRNKSKTKNSQSKKKENNQKKYNNLLNIKNTLNKSNKKEKNKPKSKENRKSQKKKNIHINTDIINENNKTLKDNCKEQIDKKNTDKKNTNKTNNNNKKSLSKSIKKNKSNPKITINKCFFRSFLCCFGYDNFDNDIKSNCNKTPVNKVINTDIDNKKLNDKKGKNNSNKKKKSKKVSSE